VSWCKTSDIASATEGEAPLISQDLNALTNSDGKIVESQTIDLCHDWAAGRDYYKIRYLSNGLEVVGFIVTPRKKSKKYPVIIYNRGGNREYGKITKEQQNI
jgi:hypothetical protein